MDVTSPNLSPDNQSHKRKPIPRLFKWLILAFVFILIAIPASIAIYIAGGAPGGIGNIAKVVNGQQVGRFGKLKLEGVSETRTGAKIAQLSLSDKQGVWLIVKSLEFDWKPNALLARRLDVSRLEAKETSLLRQPILGPPGKSRPMPIDVSIKRFATNLRISNGFYSGLSAISHQTSGQITLNRNATFDVNLKSNAVSGPADQFQANIMRALDKPISIKVNADGGPNGIINSLLGAPGAPNTQLELAVLGDIKSGEARGRLLSADQTSAQLAANWNAESGQMTGFAAPHPESWLGENMMLLGGRLDVSAQADALKGQSRNIIMTANAPALLGRFTGPVDFQRGLALKNSKLKLERANLALLSNQSVAGLVTGEFDVEGGFSPRVGSLKGQVNAISLRGFGLSLNRVTSALDIAATDTRIKISADAQGQMGAVMDPRLAPLGTNPKLILNIEQDRPAATWILNKAQLTGKGLRANATGRLGRDVRQIEGKAEFADISALIPDITGRAQVDVNLRQTTGSPWQGKANVRGDRINSANPVIAQLVGNRIDAEIVPVGSLTNDAFTWQIRTGASQARGTLDLKNRVPLQGIWELKAPLEVSGVTLSGFARRGAVGDLAFGPAGFAVGSRGSRIAIGGWTLDNASLLAVGGGGGKPIIASVEGIAPLGPASVSASISNSNNVTNITNIVARHAGLEAKGNGRSVGSTFDALFDLNLQPGAVLVSGATSGKLGIVVREGKVGVAADMVLVQAAFANVPLQVPNGRFRAMGLLGGLALNFDGAVRSGNQQGRLTLAGTADLDGRETSLVMNGSGNIGGQAFVLSQPIRAVPLGTKARITGQALWGDYRLGLDGQVRGGGLDVKFVDVAGPALSARLSGRLGGAAYALRGTARASNLASFNPRFRGSAGGNLTITGSGAQGWTAQLLGEGTNLSVGSADLDTLLGAQPRFTLVARGAPRRDITGSWKLAGKQLSGEGIVSPPQSGGLINASGIWRIEGPVKLGGVDVVGRIDGNVRLQDGAFGLTATSPNLTFAGQPWTGFRAQANVANILMLNEIPIEAVANGTLGPLKLNTTFVSATTPSLRPLVVSYGGIEGRGALLLGNAGPTGTLALQGSLGAILTSGSASGSVTLSQASSGPQLAARLGLSNVAIADAGITGLNGTLAANGLLQDLTASLDTNFNLRGEAASTRLSGRFNQTGDNNRLSISGGGTYQNAAWRLAEPLLVTAQNKTTRASARAVWREADLSFNGVLSGSALNVTANLSDAPASLFNQGQTRLAGRLSGTLKLSGQGRNFGGEGELRAVGLRPVSTQEREAIDGLITAELRNGALVVRGNATNPRGLRAVGDARLPVVTSLSPFRLAVVRTGAINGSFEVGGPVEALAKLALSRNSTASGTIAARGQLSGTVASPSIQGRAELINAALRDPNLGVRVTDANAVVNFLGPIADVQTLTASDGRGGKLQLGGRIAFRQGADWRLIGQLDRFQLIDRSEALIVASGPWSLASATNKLVLGGDLVLDNTRIGIPAGTNRGDVLRVREINRPVSLGAVPKPSPNFASDEARAQNAGSNDLNLDLKITSDGNARVVSRGFDGYFDLGLTVKGSVKQPRIAGRADLDRGRFDLAGRSFDMTKGSVRFQSPLEASRIEFIAERETADITALAKIEGTLGRPAFRLESTPPSPQDEILARILFGRNVAALSLPQAAQLALGVSSLATGNQLDPTVRLGQALGLERFSLGTESGGFAGFTAGLRLVRDVYVEVTTGGEDGTVTMLEWRPRRRVQVQVTTTQNRDSSVSVRFRSKD